MKKFILISALACFSSSIIAQTFDDFIVYINNVSSELRQSRIDSFLNTEKNYPIAEYEKVHFIYSGSGSSVSVAGDFNGWNSVNGPLVKISNTNFWYRSYSFENDARLDYKFVINGSNWILDPRNPFRVPGGFGDNSELRMLAYVPSPEIEYYPEIPHGSIEVSSFNSTNLGNSRQIKIYLPPGYAQTTDDYPVVLVHDGLEYLTFSKMNNILDYMIAENKIKPTIAVFVPPVDRSPEYADGKQLAFTSFIVEELMPWVDQNYRTLEDPGSRAVIGSSLGGNISLWLGMNSSNNFGNVGAFSSFIESDILSYFGDSPRQDLRIYMNHGRYDHLDAIHQSVYAFLPILESKAYDYLFEEYPEGHSYGFWRSHISDAMMFFFPGAAASIADEKVDLKINALSQNSPNPFSQMTNIKYKINNFAKVKIEVINDEGRIVKVLVNAFQLPGEHQVDWNGMDNSGNNLPSGAYYYCLYEGNSKACHKMIKIKTSVSQ